MISEAPHSKLLPAGKSACGRSGASNPTTPLHKIDQLKLVYLSSLLLDIISNAKNKMMLDLKNFM